MVNTCKEFHILPLSKGNPFVRDFRPFVRRINPWRRGGFFSLQILYQNQQETSSESLTKGQNYHFHLFFSGEEPSLTEGPNELHYNYHTSNQCNGSSPSLTEGPSGFHYNFDIKSTWNIILMHIDLMSKLKNVQWQLGFCIGLIFSKFQGVPKHITKLVERFPGMFSREDDQCYIEDCPSEEAWMNVQMFSEMFKCPNVQSSVPMFKCLVRCSGKRGNRFSKKVEKATTASLFVPLVSTTSSCSNEKWVHFACEVRSEIKQKEIFTSYKIKNHLQCLHFGINLYIILQSL